MIKDWIDIVRSAEYFDLAKNANGRGFPVHEITGGDESLLTSYEYLYSIGDNVSEDFPGKPPDFIAMTNAHSSVNDKSEPHAEYPAPAQHCSSIVFMWGERNEPLELLPGDLHVSDMISLHRDDGFPAMIEAIGFKKHYANGKLHRKGPYAALSADYIFVHWADEKTPNQRIGPSIVSISDYKEYWKDGVFTGHKWNKITPFWSFLTDKRMDIDNFLANLRGNQNPFSNNYFDNQEDEFIFIADFA